METVSQLRSDDPNAKIKSGRHRIGCRRSRPLECVVGDCAEFGDFWGEFGGNGWNEPFGFPLAIGEEDALQPPQPPVSLLQQQRWLERAVRVVMVCVLPSFDLQFIWACVRNLPTRICY
jgi:hypothetical protein